MFAKKITKEEKKESPKMKKAEKKAGVKKTYSAKAAVKGKDLGKPGKNFAKIAESAGKKYGSKTAGKKVAGAILKRLRNK